MRQPYPAKNRAALFGLIVTHLQIVLGLVLYFVSPKVMAFSEAMSNSAARFYTVEHLVGMLLAGVLITIGYSRAKRRAGMPGGYRTIAIFYGIGLLLVLLSIPWPFRGGLGGSWF